MSIGRSAVGLSYLIILCCCACAGAAHEPRPIVLAAPDATPAPLPTVAPMGMTSCPDSSDGPSLVMNVISSRYRAFASDRSSLPLACWIAAIASSPSMPDSTVWQALTLGDALARRDSTDLAVLVPRFTLLFRDQRYADIPPAFDKLVAIDQKYATLERLKMAIASSERLADTAATIRYLKAGATKYTSDGTIAGEYDVYRNAGRLHALIDTVHKAMLADPKRTGGLLSLVSIYGNLGIADSALRYTRFAIGTGMSIDAVATSLKSLTQSVLRHAQFLDAPDTWEQTLVAAIAIDSTLSTDDSKYLVAISASKVATARFLLMRRKQPPIPLDLRPEVCPRVVEQREIVARANERLAAGGERFAPGSASSVRRQLAALSAQLDPLHQICTAK